jgi:hypothetical protein
VAVVVLVIQLVVLLEVVAVVLGNLELQMELLEPQTQVAVAAGLEMILMAVLFLVVQVVPA